MVEYSRYRRERLSSEQVEKFRNDFANGVHIRTPEPRLEAVSETFQPVTIESLRSALLKRKRKRKNNNTSALRKSEPCNTSPEPDLDVAVETSQPTRLGLSLSAPPTQKRKGTTEVLGELESNEKSPELESVSGSETHRSITRGSSQSPSRKRKRKSKMLRELDPHNESPEQDSEPGIGMLYESTEKRCTRNVAHKFASFLENKKPARPKNLNVNRLMYAELQGTPKGKKTWYFPDDSNPRSSSQQKQPESRQSIDIKIHTMSQQSRKPSGKSRQDQARTPESAWSKWDREKGQSTLNTALTAPLLQGTKCQRSSYLTTDHTLVIPMYISIHTKT